MALVGALIIIICTRKAGCSVFLGVKNKKDREGMLIVIFFEPLQLKSIT